MSGLHVEVEADRAVCHWLGSMHLSGKHATSVVRAAREGDAHAVAEALRDGLHLEHRLLNAAADIARAVHGEEDA